MSVQTCKRCLYRDDHPLGLVIDEEGICSGCRIHEEKDQLDWGSRWQELEQLVAPYRSRDTRNHDCIVPVTGAGDSHFIVHTVVNRLKLKPLLVTHNRYYNTPIGIRNLANLRRKFNADILIQNINPRSVKAIIRTTLRRLGSFHWPAIAGQTVFPVQTSVNHKIPLIIWGAHQGLEQVGMFSHLHNVEMTRRYRKDHDLMGLEADDILTIFDNLREEDIWQYRYPRWDDINSVGVRGIYLGNYIRWDPIAQHRQMVELYNYKSAQVNRTFDIYDHVDDLYYADIHDQIKTLKLGYGKATDHACREIRHKRIIREEGIILSQSFQNKSPTNKTHLLKWLNLTSEAFDFTTSNNYRLRSNSKLEARINKSTGSSKVIKKLELNPNSTIDLGTGTKTIVIGKGYDHSKEK